MVDVLTLNYNDSKTTIAFVKSVLCFSCVRKILVVDNCSTDDSIDELKRIESDKVEIIESPKNGGYGFGNNLGIRFLHEHYASKYILLANPDVIVSEITIQKLERFLCANKEYSLVAPMMTNMNGIVQYNSAFKLPNKKHFLLSFEILLSRKRKPLFYDNLETVKKEIFDVDSVAGSLFMMDAEKMIEFGMFDENVFLYSEEIILGLKFRKAGLKMALLTSEKYIHNHSVSISKSYKLGFTRNILLNKSKLYVLKEYYNANIIVVLIANVLVVINLMETLLVDVIKRLRNISG